MSPPRPIGLRIIIAYKILKAAAQVGLAIYLFYGASHGLAARLVDLADALREHAIPAVSHLLARALTRFNEQPYGLRWVATALAVDAVVSAFEAWALASGRAWGPWIVVGATASLIPFEVLALCRHLRVGRVVALVINAVILVYLVRRARRPRRSGE